MSNYRAEIKKNELDDILPRILKALDRTKQLAALGVHGNIEENAPVDHGYLAGNWNVAQRGDEYIVGTHVKYAAIQNFGGKTKPHVIRAKNKPYLHFQVDGQWVRVKEVNHPGSKIKGKKYIEKSIEEAEDRLDDFIHKALKEGGLI